MKRRKNKLYAEGILEEVLRLRAFYSPSLFFFSSRRRHTRCLSDWSSDVCSSDLEQLRGDRSELGPLRLRGQAIDVGDHALHLSRGLARLRSEARILRQQMSEDGLRDRKSVV